MKILLTGANGYIGKRLLPALLEAGHEIVALVRIRGLDIPECHRQKVQIVVIDLFDSQVANLIPKDIDAAYYLIHSMGDGSKDFAEMEAKVAYSFLELIMHTNIKQIIYLSGLINEGELSKHLASRLNVEKILRSGPFACTVLRASIIIGSGSASFEIIRDLVEKLPVMVAPKWINNLSQPIGISDVVGYLIGVLGNTPCLNRVFDIGGPEVLSFKEMLLQLAEIRGLRRYILTVPVLTPRISAYWLFFITSTNFTLAKTLVESMRNNTICQEFSIQEYVPRKCLSYAEAVKRAFSRIEQNMVVSSWKDSWMIAKVNPDLNEYVQVPKNGCFTDQRVISFQGDPEAVVDRIWSIGGRNGWYYMDWAWHFRGFLDKVVGGVGLRRGRRDPERLEAGDSLDFWRVLLADREQKRLLLYAEMKLPGEAWLEFKVVPKGEGYELQQTATFRPNGLWGRLYWYLVSPFHFFIFQGMANGLVSGCRRS